MRTQYQKTDIIREDSNNRKNKTYKKDITGNMKKNRCRRIINVVQQIKSNVDNGGKYGKSKKKFREQIKRHVLSKMKNNRLDCSSQILEKYKKYKNLVKTRQSETTEKTHTECKVGKEFQQITNRLENRKEKSTETIMRNEIIRIKNKRASDKYLFVADTKHYLDKFWLKDCVIEM